MSCILCIYCMMLLTIYCTIVHVYLNFIMSSSSIVVVVIVVVVVVVVLAHMEPCLVLIHIHRDAVKAMHAGVY